MLTAIQKRAIGKVLHARWFTGILVVLAMFLVVASYRAYMSMLGAQERYRVAEAEYMLREEQEADIQKRLHALEDPRGREAELRERYSVAKEGEVILIVPEVVPEKDAITPETSSIWEKIRNFLGL